jgi:hypothetical protein
VATGRASQAGQVEGKVPEKAAHPGPPGWELGMRPTTSSHKRNNC